MRGGADVSKAFTSEETPDTGPVIREPPRLAPGEVRWVTPEGQAALRAELARLRDAGDARAALVERTLGVLTVLGPESAPEGTVGFGTWVTVKDDEGAKTTWRIVGPDETSAREHRVSVHAPLAQALMGHVAGDVVEVRRPAGETELTIVEVSRTAP
jgi:transcription elongation factor GreB